nr:hypothetical protein HmN_000969000 [Hymenolepis microstoma]
MKEVRVNLPCRRITLRRDVSNMSRGGIPKDSFARHLESWLRDILEVAYVFNLKPSSTTGVTEEGKQAEAVVSIAFISVKSILKAVCLERDSKDVRNNTNPQSTKPPPKGQSYWLASRPDLIQQLILISSTPTRFLMLQHVSTTTITITCYYHRTLPTTVRHLLMTVVVAMVVAKLSLVLVVEVMELVNLSFAEVVKSSIQVTSFNDPSSYH